MFATPQTSSRKVAKIATQWHVAHSNRMTKPTPAALEWIAGELSTHPGELVIEPLRAEASHRSFFRVAPDSTGRRTVIFMASPPHLERNAQFIHLAKTFRDAGVSVPEIIAIAEETGWLLMTDLGSIHLESLYADPATQATSLELAIRHLPALSRVSDPMLDLYSTHVLRKELDIFNEWFATALLEHSTPLPCTELLVSTIDAQPKCCVHLDYHCRNLLVRDGELGIVDFQDARFGPVLYDIASLLRDCYYAFDESTVERWFTYFLSLQPLADAIENPKRTFDFTAIQRQLKAVGIFARLYLRDAKTTHLAHIDPVLHRLIDLTQRYDELSALHQHLAACADRLPAAWIRHGLPHR